MGATEGTKTMSPLPAEPGTYALLLRSDTDRTVDVGRLGSLNVRPGWYVYVGSALGPGGLAARVGRHLRREKTCRWHIDYLRAVTVRESVWYATGTSRVECRWATVLAGMKKATVPLEGFGASDCRCRSHLVWFPTRPSVKHLQKKLADAMGANVLQVAVAGDGLSLPRGPAAGSERLGRTPV